MSVTEGVRSSVSVSVSLCVTVTTSEGDATKVGVKVSVDSQVAVKVAVGGNCIDADGASESVIVADRCDVRVGVASNVCVCDSIFVADCVVRERVQSSDCVWRDLTCVKVVRSNETERFFVAVG